MVAVKRVLCSICHDDGMNGLALVGKIELDEANPLILNKEIAIFWVNDSRQGLKVSIIQSQEALTLDHEIFWLLPIYKLKKQRFSRFRLEIRNLSFSSIQKNGYQQPR